MEVGQERCQDVWRWGEGGVGVWRWGEDGVGVWRRGEGGVGVWRWGEGGIRREGNVRCQTYSCRRSMTAAIRARWCRCCSGRCTGRGGGVVRYNLGAEFCV